MPSFKHRGIMLDLARLLETRGYYEGLLPWLKEWGYNTLHLHFADDEGCAVVLPSHPELATEGAFTPAEMKAFIRLARRNGLTVIPELETLGHTRFITGNRKYRQLGSAQGRRSIFNSIHPGKREVRVLLRDLLRDVAALFPARILHAGLDEVDMSAFPEYRHLERKDQWRAFAAHAAWVHEEIRKLGKRPAMWGDHLLDSPPLAGRLDKDVLIFDWHYNAPFHPGSLDRLLGAGFEVWGCPASMHWNERVLPSVRNTFQNMREFAAESLVRRARGCTGMVNTVWCPWRYLSGVMDLPMAFCGHLFAQEAEAAGFAADFAAGFYGLRPADARVCGELIWQLHAVAPMRERFARTVREPAALNREDVRQLREMAAAARQVERRLPALVRRACRHAERLHDYVLSARILQVLGAYGASAGTAPAPARIRRLLKECDRSWWATKAQSWEPKNPLWNQGEWLLPALRDMAGPAPGA